MLFNSFEFAIFLPVVFTLYWFILKKNLRAQNFFLLAAAYVFYGWWDWRFLFLIAFSSGLDYFIGLRLARIEKQQYRRMFFGLSCLVNLGFLGFFKYYNFFVDSFISAFSGVGIQLEARTLNIILPVGISFYTFQSMSYVLDIYRRRMEPTRDIIAFFGFVSFFPHLVAGPIQQATNLLPQFYTPRTFDPGKARDGMRQILWGLFKKVVIADNCAPHVNYIFDHYTSLPASTLFVGAIYFAFQIYGDFSGYSDIAIGCARLFGFNLTRNFAYPYFSRDIAEFWRRWHISLSTWFREYLYIPLGGSRGTMLRTAVNTIIVFVVSGFWHGANWTFIGWGALNGAYFLPLLLTRKNRVHTGTVAEGKTLPTLRELWGMAITFLLTLFGWILFRSKTIADAWEYMARLFSATIMTVPHETEFRIIAPLILLSVVVEWIQRGKQHGLQIESIKSRPLRWLIYYSVILFILIAGRFNKTEFIYFAF